MKETILPETRFGLLTTKELTKNKEGKKGMALSLRLWK